MDAGAVVVGAVAAVVTFSSMITVVLPVFLVIAAAKSPARAPAQATQTAVPLGALAALDGQAEPTAHIIEQLRTLADNDPALHAVVEAHVRALTQALIAHQALQCHLSAQWKMDNTQTELDEMNQISWDRVQTQVLALVDLHLGETRRLLELDPSGDAALEAQARRLARREMG
jgi:hypothetical protein